MKLTEEQFLQAELDAGISLDNPNFMALAKQTAELIEKICEDYLNLEGLYESYKDVHILDYGPGVGAYSKSLLEIGMRVSAYEKFKSHQEYIRKNIPSLILHDEPVKCNMLLMIEVAEHMTDEEIYDVISKSSPELIFFSSTPHKTPNDEEWGHINVKSTNTWDKFFEEMESKTGLCYVTVGFSIIPTEWTRIYCKIRENAK